MVLESFINFRVGQTVSPNPHCHLYRTEKAFELNFRYGEVTQVSWGNRYIHVKWWGSYRTVKIDYKYLRIISEGQNRHYGGT